jgi:voltage-gated potassium channel
VKSFRALYIPAMRRLVRTHNYWNVLLSQIFLLFLATFMKDFLPLYILFIIALLGIFGSVVANIWETMIPRALAFVSGGVALVSGFVWAMPGLNESTVIIMLAICALSFAAFALIAITSIGHHVFVREMITKDRIVGSICIYMLIGMFFAFLYAGLDVIRPGSFTFSGKDAYELEDFRDYLYFSYVTLTTTGFGDMSPILPLARLLTYLETVVGSLYLVIMVASLVGIHVSQAARKQISKQ